MCPATRTDCETYFCDGELADAKQRHGALDSPGHQVAVRRFAVGQLELPGQMARRHVYPAREGFHVEGLGVVAVHPIAHPAQQREVAQSLRVGAGGHAIDAAISGPGQPVAAAVGSGR
jgi:hypothetical protein